MAISIGKNSTGNVTYDNPPVERVLFPNITEYATAEAIEEFVNAWLDDHPEATTTVEDGSILPVKLDSTNEATDGYVLSYNATAGKFEWYDIEGELDEINSELGNLKEDFDQYNTEVLGLYPQMQIEDTAVASFTDGADNIPVKSLTVDVTPVQDLHGQDAPYPAGGKGNIFHTTANSKTENGVTWHINEDGSVTVSGTATDFSSIDVGRADISGIAGSVTVNANVNSDNNVVFSGIYLYDENGTNVGTAYSGGAQQTHVIDVSQYPTATKIGVSFKRNNNVATSGTYKIQVVKGTTAGEWYPYSNICPISGWTGAKVTRTGKNLFDGESWLQANNIEYTVVSGYLQFQASSTLYNHFFDVFSGTKTVSFEVGSGTTATNVRLRVKYANGTINDNMYTTATGDIVGVAINYSNNGLIQLKVQLEEGSTATAYEPFGTVYNIDWTTEAGTVYGGTLDVTSGVLTVDHFLWQKNTSDMDNTNIQYPGWRNSGITDIFGSGLDQKVSNQMLNIGTEFNINTIPGGGDVLWLNVNTYGKNQNEWKALAIDVQIYLPLVTPQTYQLTPTEVDTLLGQNNIFCDTGNINELTYRADLKAYIDEHVGS